MNKDDDVYARTIPLTTYVCSAEQAAIDARAASLDRSVSGYLRRLALEDIAKTVRDKREAEQAQSEVNQQRSTDTSNVTIVRSFGRHSN